MNKLKKLYRDFFGLAEAVPPTSNIPKILPADEIEKSIQAVQKYGKAMKDAGLIEADEIDEAQLVNHIHDYRGGVEYVLRDASQAKEVAAQIQDWTTKKGFTVVKHTISKSGKIGYFYFRLGEDPEREAQRIQGYFSSKIEIKFFRFKVKEEQTPQRTIAQSKI